MKGYRLGKIFGIQVDVHGSWLIIGGLLLWTFTANILPLDFPQLGPGLRFGMAVVITLFFFGSLLAHELAHSVVAMARGIPVHRITFFLFGGMAQTDTESRSAGEEFLIAVAGPVMSFLLAGLFLGLWLPGSEAATGAHGAQAAGALRLAATGIAFYLMYLNVILGTFNLLPGFPMDGGRVLRAIIWKATGDVTRATRWASRVGSGMAMLLMGYGIWEALTGQLISGMWLVLIGMFIRNAARSSYRYHLISRMQEMTQQAWGSHRHQRRQPRPEPGGGAGPGAGSASGPAGEPDWPPPGRDVTGLSGDA